MQLHVDRSNTLALRCSSSSGNTQYERDSCTASSHAPHLSPLHHQTESRIESLHFLHQKSGRSSLCRRVLIMDFPSIPIPSLSRRTNHDQQSSHSSQEGRAVVS